MKDLTIIVPVKEYKASDKTLLSKAISSVKVNDFDYEIIVVGPDSVVKKVKEDYKDRKDLKTIVNKGNTDICSQVNLAVDKAGEYFTVLEFDDWFSETWFKNVKHHIINESEPISLYLPLIEVVDFESGEPVGYINEAVLASSFSDRLGYIDAQCIEDFSNFNLTGGVFKTSDFVEVGKLKSSMKLSFWYEYLLRATQNAKVTYVIPKVGYYHTIGRPGSIVETCKKELSDEEAKWWYELARKEYFFKEDRGKTYE